MIIRIVKMTFQADKAEEFIRHFKSVKEQIRAFPGCTSVSLHRDTADQLVFYTYSTWKSEDDLNLYRKSDLFRSTWSLVKTLFASRAEAFSMEPAED